MRLFQHGMMTAFFVFNLGFSLRKTARRRAFRHFHNRGSPPPPHGLSPARQTPRSGNEGLDLVFAVFQSFSFAVY